MSCRGESYQQTIRVFIPDNLASGRYYITPWSDSVDIVLEDTLAINLNPDDPNEVDNNNYKARAIDIIGVPPAAIRDPDLVVSAVTATPQVQAGNEQITVNWTVTNAGHGNADSETIWSDTIILSDKPTLNAAGAVQITLGTIARVGGLPFGQSYSDSATFDLPPSAAGKYVFVVTDTGGLLREENENNNIGRGDTSVNNTPADLRVESISSPSVNYSGETTTVTWTVKNYGGDVWTGTRLWLDAVWVSAYPTFNPLTSKLLNIVAHDNSATLRAGQTYTVTAEGVLPPGIDGPYYLYVVLDSDEYGRAPKSEAASGNAASQREFFAASVFEGDNGTTNNYGSGIINVTYREPNLKVTNLLVEDNPAQSGGIITVDWTVSNIGTRATREDLWTDRVFLSRDSSLDTGDISLGDFIRHGKLEAGSSYQASVDVRLPDGISGNFYLLVQTDTTARTNGYVPQHHCSRVARTFRG